MQHGYPPIYNFNCHIQIVLIFFTMNKPFFVFIIHDLNEAVGFCVGCAPVSIGIYDTSYGY